MREPWLIYMRRRICAFVRHVGARGKTWVGPSGCTYRECNRCYQIENLGRR